MVMPSNLVKKARLLDERFPGGLGCLFGVRGWQDPKGLPYAIDNGRYPVWSAGKAWDPDLFYELLGRATKVSYPPLWAVVPDVVADCEATVLSWKEWSPKVSRFGFPIALAVQDGMTSNQVKSLRPRPDVIFVGGSTKWKWRTLWSWCRGFPRVHVGRVNGYRLLWTVQKAGAESSDGTRWFQHNQARQLELYLERSSLGLRQTEVGFIP